MAQLDSEDNIINTFEDMPGYYDYEKRDLAEAIGCLLFVTWLAIVPGIVIIIALLILGR